MIRLDGTDWYWDFVTSSIEALCVVGRVLERSIGLGVWVCITAHLMSVVV